MKEIKPTYKFFHQFISRHDIYREDQYTPKDITCTITKASTFETPLLAPKALAEHLTT